MAIQEGTYTLGPSNGSLTVETGRAGAAAAAGHDLTIDVTSWEATLTIGAASSLELTADPSSLQVVKGEGGMKGLTDDNKGEIRNTIDKDILKKKAISFSSSSVDVSDGRLQISGELELNGQKQPVSFDLTESGGTISGTATVSQSNWKIKQYSALFGALKVADDVKVIVDAQVG